MLAVVGVPAVGVDGDFLTSLKKHGEGTKTPDVAWRVVMLHERPKVETPTVEPPVASAKSVEQGEGAIELQMTNSRGLYCTASSSGLQLSSSAGCGRFDGGAVRGTGT